MKNFFKVLFLSLTFFCLNAKAANTYYEVKGSLADGAYSFEAVFKLLGIPLPPSVLSMNFVPVIGITGTFSNGLETWDITGLRTTSVLPGENPEDPATPQMNTFRSGQSPFFSEPGLRFSTQGGYLVNLHLTSGEVVGGQEMFALTNAPGNDTLFNSEPIKLAITSVVQVPPPPIPAVPEPSTYVLLLAGLGLLASKAKRKKLS